METPPLDIYVTKTLRKNRPMAPTIRQAQINASEAIFFGQGETLAAAYKGGGEGTSTNDFHNGEVPSS